MVMTTTTLGAQPAGGGVAPLDRSNISQAPAQHAEVVMPRTFRLAVPLGLFLLAVLAFPSIVDAQQRGGGGGRGGARGTAVVRGGGPAVRGGGVYGRSHVAVPRTHPPYYNYRPYYSRGYYRPYYPGYYYPRYYSPWSWSLSFGFGWYGGAYAPFYAYPYYPAPYVTAYPGYSYPAPYASTSPSAAPAPTPSQPQYSSPASDNGYNNAFGTLSIRVQPADATILIDQRVWDRPREDDRLSLEVVEGPHHVEIRKAGYATYVRTIDVPRGRSVVLNVALTPGGTGTIQVARTVPVRR